MGDKYSVSQNIRDATEITIDSDSYFIPFFTFAKKENAIKFFTKYRSNVKDR